MFEHDPGTEHAERARESPAPSRATVRRLPRTKHALTIQAKMIVGASNDRCEQEADRVAEEVSRRIAMGSRNDEARHDERLHQVRTTRIVRSVTGASGQAGGRADVQLEGRIRRATRGGSALDGAVRTHMEQGFGTDFGRVRVHTGSEATVLNRSIGALAFTAGDHIFFGSDQYRPNTSDGQHLLAHELTHTIQQGGGHVHEPGERIPVPRRREPGSETIHRWFDEETWMLPKKEQSFKGWFDVYWENPDWISETAFEELKRLHGLLIEAQGDKQNALAAHDAAESTGQANYLEVGSNAWDPAVSTAADEIEKSGAVADKDAIEALWPGRNAEEVPETFVTAVGVEVSTRAENRKSAALSKAAAAKQQAAAAAAAIRARQTRKDWTARQVIKTCGYGGKTSVSPVWGGRDLMINQNRGYHFTQFVKNYDSNQEFASGTDIQVVIGAVFGGVGEQSFHVTQEVHGAKDKRNPHYHVTGTYKPAVGTSKVKEMSKTELTGLMTNETQRITNLLRLSS